MKIKTKRRCKIAVVLLLLLLVFITPSVMLFGAIKDNLSAATHLSETLPGAMMQLAEQAYMEGQKEALDGEVNIAYNESKDCWQWVETPWDNGRPVTYNDCN